MRIFHKLDRDLIVQQYIQQNKQMNGMKLGSNQKPMKNSFAFQNQFLNYENKSNNEEDQGDYSEVSQSQQVSHKQDIKPPAKLEQKKRSIELQINNKIQKKSSPIKQPTKEDVDKRISKLNSGMQKLSVSVLQMKDNYEDLQLKQSIIKNRNEKKEEQIKLFLQKKQQEKNNILQRKNAQIQKDKKRLQQELRIQKQAKDIKEKQIIQQKLKKIIQQRQKREMQKQRQLQQSKLACERYGKLLQQEKQVKKFHIRKLQQDENRKRQEIMQQKQILAKRKQAYKSIDFYQLQDHRRKYEEKSIQLIEQKRLLREKKLQQIEEKNVREQQFYRGHSHDYIQEQIQERQHKKKAPKQKLNRVKQYEQYIKQNHLPKTLQHRRKNRTIKRSRRNSLGNIEVKRYKYINGVAYGQVIESMPVAKSQEQKRQIGNDNLAYFKSLPKKKIILEDNSLSPQDLAILDKKLNSIVKVKAEKNPLYEMRRFTKEIKLSQKPTKDQVSMIIDQLKNQDQKTKKRQKLLKHQHQNSIDLSLKHRLINDQIVNNIERKLNLLSKI